MFFPSYKYTENYLSKKVFLVPNEYLHDEFLHPNHISAKITKSVICMPND